MSYSDIFKRNPISLRLSGLNDIVFYEWTFAERDLYLPFFCYLLKRNLKILEKEEIIISSFSEACLYLFDQFSSVLSRQAGIELVHEDLFPVFECIVTQNDLVKYVQESESEKSEILDDEISEADFYVHIIKFCKIFPGLTILNWKEKLTPKMFSALLEIELEYERNERINKAIIFETAIRCSLNSALSSKGDKHVSSFEIFSKRKEKKGNMQDKIKCILMKIHVGNDYQKLSEFETFKRLKENVKKGITLKEDINQIFSDKDVLDKFNVFLNS